MAANYFCVDFSETNIKIADINKSGNMFDATVFGSTAAEPLYFTTDTEKVQENQANYLKSLIDKLKITKKNVGIVIPDTYTYSQIMEMPKLNEKELISAIKYQADQLIPMPIDKTNIDIEIIHEDDVNKKLLVLMVAAPKSLIAKVQNTVESIGLIPEFIENELSSSSRLLSQLFTNVDPKQTTNNIIFLNLSFNSSSLYFFNSKLNAVTQIYNFNIGTNLFLKEIQINLNIDLIKAIEVLTTYDISHTTSYPIETIIAPVVKEFTFELNRFISLINQKYQLTINGVYLLNEATKFPALCKIIEKNYNIPTTLANSYNFFKKSTIVETYKNELPLYVSTIGGNLR